MFWNDRTLSPKRSWRWQAFIFFYYEEGGNVSEVDGRQGPPETKAITIPPFTISSFTKPQYGFEVLEITNNMNGRESYFSKNAKWAPITITSIDVDQTGANASKAIYDYMVKSGYDPLALVAAKPTSTAASFFGQIGKASKRSKITLQHLTGNGVIVEQWDFLRPIIKQINFGDKVDYSTDTPMQVSLTFDYVAAQYTHGTEGKNLVNRVPSTNPGVLR